MKKEVIEFAPNDLIEIEKIVIDKDIKGAYEYLKKFIKFLKKKRNHTVNQVLPGKKINKYLTKNEYSY